MAVESVMLRDSTTIAAANYYNPGSALSGPNGSGQYLAVGLSASADRTSLLASSAGQAIYGILQNSPAQGDSCDVCIVGCSKAVAGAAVTRGDQLAVDTSGRLVTATSGKVIVGQAMESAGAANVIFEAFIFPALYPHA